jgi:hypothetical protein
VGTTAGNRLAWDGTDLTLVSNNLAIGAAGVVLTTPTAFASTASYRFTDPSAIKGLVWDVCRRRVNDTRHGDL